MNNRFDCSDLPRKSPQVGDARVLVCTQSGFQRLQDIEGGLEVLLLAPLALAVPVCACVCALGPHVSMT